MKQEELNKWFEGNARIFEVDYLKHKEPWKQSGFSGPEERWIQCRKPIANYIDKDGSFLDIGCANGYLLECIVMWKKEEGLSITPFGLDIGQELIELAKCRLHGYKDNLFVANAFTWMPPIQFDFVRTEIVYVPEDYRNAYIRRLLDEFLKPNGKLLVCEYRSSRIENSNPWIDTELVSYGFKVLDCSSGYYDGKELTRVARLGADGSA